MYLNETEKLPQPSETLDSYIKRLRLLLHLSQQELATKAGIHLQSLGKLERGGRQRLNVSEIMLLIWRFFQGLWMKLCHSFFDLLLHNFTSCPIFSLCRHNPI